MGDLAGKHGLITSDPFAASYSDDFASTVEGLGSFFGNRSLTLHFGNATRITCANFTLQSGSAGEHVGTGTGGTTNGTATATSRPVQFTGKANSFFVAPVLYFFALGALALML